MDRWRGLRPVDAKSGITQRRNVAWARSSYHDLLRLPKDAQAKLGKALQVAQEGGMHENARPMHDSLREVIEIVANCADGTYRLMYTTEISEEIYVLHAFKKKAHHGIATPKKELALIENRLKDAKEKVRRG